MANSINVNGCSVCQPGRENYTSFTAKIGRKSVKRWQYDYRTESGKVTVWDLYNGATELYKADTMDIPALLPQNRAMVGFLSEQFGI